MIRINWSEVEDTKNKLLRSGVTDAMEMVIIIFYHNKLESDKMQIRLNQLEKVLFDLGANAAIRSLFLYDLAMKRPFLKFEEAQRASVGEEIPTSGHCSVVAEFGKMSPEAKDVWLEIAWAQQQHYVSEQV